jgi:hypothetical protein
MRLGFELSPEAVEKIRSMMNTAEGDLIISRIAMFLGVSADEVRNQFEDGTLPKSLKRRIEEAALSGVDQEALVRVIVEEAVAVVAKEAVEAGTMVDLGDGRFRPESMTPEQRERACLRSERWRRAHGIMPRRPAQKPWLAEGSAGRHGMGGAIGYCQRLAI